MTGRSRPIPPTRRLAQLLRSGGASPPVPSDPAGWAPVLAVADRHRLVPALAAAGLEAGWLRALPASARRAVAARAGALGPPAEVRLLDALAANRARVDALLDQGGAVLAALDAAGVPAVPLKGLDALLRGRYPEPGARTMTDLDVLVPHEQAATAWDALRAAGFVPVDAPAAEHHLAPLARPGAPGSVELHTELLRGRWRSGLPGAALLARSEPAPDGQPGRRLSPVDSLVVLVAHAQLQDEGRVLLDLPLRALHETALAQRAGSGEGARDRWLAVAERTEQIGPGAAEALAEHLWLTEALFGAAAPLPVAPAARRHGRLVLAVADRPRARRALGQVAFLPRSFSPERMVALHGGPASGPGLWWTRARHAAHGLVRRVGEASPGETGGARR